MTIDDDKLDKLERCAEAATDGPWTSEASVLEANVHNNRRRICEVRGGFFDQDSDCRPNCEHIAAADPPTVLELVREVRRLREALEEIAGAIEWDTDPRSIRHLCDMAEEALEDTDE